MIKIAVLSLCLCVAHLVSAGLFTRKVDKTSRNSLSASGVHAAQNSGYLSKGRRRPLFARRGQYERQKPRVLKHNVASGFPDDLSSASKVSKTTTLKCSELTQSCLPKSRCCDPCTTCHCHVFKTICFCWRTEERKRQTEVNSIHLIMTTNTSQRSMDGLSNRPRGQKDPGPQSK